MKVLRHDKPAEFLERAEGWLSLHEAENNVPLGVARRLSGEGVPADPACYWATIEDRGAVVGCAFRTPPYLLSLTRLPLEAIGQLADDVQGFYDALPGVGGPRDAASRFAEEWSARTGRAWRVRAQLYLHELTSVQFPEHPPAGSLRRMLDTEFDLIRSWAASFVYDTGIAQDPADLAERLRASTNVYIWDDAGPRCMVSAMRDTPNGICVTAVYTPPPDRGRGYASVAVATLSEQVLRRGKQFCCLYTDAANPTSNSIYRKIGYRPLREDVDIDFFHEDY